MSHPTSELRAEHDVLLHRLSSRASTLHFAVASIALFASLILAGTAGKLWWDFGEKHQEWTMLVGAVALGGLVFSSVRYLAGRRELTQELEGFARLTSLRRELKLDDSAVPTP